MSSLEEKLERAEKVAHISSKHVGLTIALIGVLIAFCGRIVNADHSKQPGIPERVKSEAC